MTRVAVMNPIVEPVPADGPLRKVTLLEKGNCLTRPEFERRYEATPPIKGMASREHEEYVQRITHRDE